MVSANRVADRGISEPVALAVHQFLAERMDSIGDEGQKKSERLIGRESIHRSIELKFRVPDLVRNDCPG